MGGSGGGSYLGKEDPAEVRRQVQEELRRQRAEAEINAFLGEQLAAYNSRDSELTRERLDALAQALGDDAIEVDRLMFGGSVAKHTYVDGLSDVDALVVVDPRGAQTPAEVLGAFAFALSARLPQGQVAAVGKGGLAVTVTYNDGGQVQLLPAVERGGHTSIGTEDGTGWRQIRPHKFAEKLTQVNQANGGAVVPTIKLGKALIARLPPEHRLSGYHVEAIAVDAFKGYQGRRDRASLLRHLVEHASRAVMRPTGDITGQSVHVDAHWGAAGSAARAAVAGSLRTLAARMNAAQSGTDYARLFDD